MTPREKDLVERAVRLAREEWEGRYASLPPAELLAQIDEALACLRAERDRLRAELGMPPVTAGPRRDSDA